MNPLINKPHQVAWYIIPAILVLSLIGKNNTLDLQMHDTYFVMASLHIGIFFSILLALTGLAYFLFRKKRLINWMTATHLALFIISILAISISLFFTKAIMSNIETFRMVNTCLMILLLIGMLSKIIFICNLITGTIRGNKLRPNE